MNQIDKKTTKKTESGENRKLVCTKIFLCMGVIASLIGYFVCLGIAEHLR